MNFMISTVKTLKELRRVYTYDLPESDITFGGIDRRESAENKAKTAEELKRSMIVRA